MTEERAAGVLLHISSLPGKYGIGTFGDEAYRFVDLLSQMKVRYWQILPLVQTGFGDSPYQSVYSGSGNPYFIDLEILEEEGLLKRSELAECRYKKANVDYSFLYKKKYAVLRRAFERFDLQNTEFRAFVEEGEFEGYALFMALKKQFAQVSFYYWPREYKKASPAALKKFKEENMREYLFWQFLQYVFRKQWLALKKYANDRNVLIIGDLPLYVAYDSVDVWQHPELFKLNNDLSLKVVAGVPPDFFSETGQLWGNPVYRWSAHKKDGYSWWIERLRQAYRLYDVVRLDHFRGFDRYYEIGADSPNAVHGVWRSGPKSELFRFAEQKLGKLNIIAEDLGVQDAGVRRLVRETGYPRMKIMGFAFDGDPKNPYLPKYIEENSVCYTGTHDNDTMLGFLYAMKPKQYAAFHNGVSKTLTELGETMPLANKKQVVRAVVKIAMLCPSWLTVIPMQDILVQNNRSRMNLPGTVGENWKYRLKHRLSAEELAFFGELDVASDRA